MNFKILAVALYITCFAFASRAQTNIWTFKKGGKFQGTPVEFKNTNLVVMVSSADRKRYNIVVSLLTDDDQKAIRAMMVKNTEDKTSNDLEAAGQVKITAKLANNFPEKIDGKSAFIIGKFEKIDNSSVKIWLPDFERDAIGFAVADSEGESFYHCFANKNGPLRKGLEDELQTIRAGDVVCVKGKAVTMNTPHEWLYANSIEVLSRIK